MKLSVSKIEPLTKGIKRFEFHHPDGNALPEFEAGAHVEIAVLPELKRRYSLVSDPEDLSYYAIAVLRHESGKG
jgi:ferredoxin-NADP reductase